MDELPVCTHVIARDGGPSASGLDAAAPPLPGADAGRSGAKRVGGGPVNGAGAVKAGGPADTITLDSTARYRRRVRMTSDNGTAFLLDLPSARLLREGDRLVLSDRSTIEVRAAAESLYEVRGGSTEELLKLAWHVGNRHLPTEVREDHLRIREDAVIRRMLEGLGARVNETSAGFDPEGGAYADGADGRAHSHAYPHDPGNASGDA